MALYQCTSCVQAWCTKDINSGANLHHRCITDHFEDDGDDDDGDLQWYWRKETMMLMILMSNFLLRVPSADGFECFGPRRFSPPRLSHCIRTADHPVINWFSSIKKEIFNCAFFFFGKYLSYNFLTLLCFYNPGNLGPGQFQAPSSQLILNETTGPPKLVKPPKKDFENFKFTQRVN